MKLSTILKSAWKFQRANMRLDGLKQNSSESCAMFFCSGLYPDDGPTFRASPLRSTATHKNKNKALVEKKIDTCHLLQLQILIITLYQHAS